MGSFRSHFGQILIVPSAALARSGGFLFLAVSFCQASGSPWLDRLGIAVPWLLESPLDTTSTCPPPTGVSVRSTAELGLRAPLRANWHDAEIDQTLSGSTTTESLKAFGWLQTSTRQQRHDLQTSSFALETPSATVGIRAGVQLKTPAFSLRLENHQAIEQNTARASVSWARARIGLELGAARDQRRSQLRIGVSEGTLQLGWSDVSDSLGASLSISVGPTRWNARTWASHSASPQHQGLMDSGEASGWGWGIEFPSRWGTGQLRLERAHYSLHTLGSQAGRSFHDQWWQAIRVGLDAQWRTGPYSASLSTRQIQLDFPVGASDHPFLDWNMIPEDGFARIASVLKSQSQYLSGQFHCEHWSARIERSWQGPILGLRTGIGISEIGFDARVDRTTLLFNALIPQIVDDIPVNGSGWLALAELRAGVNWNPPTAGSFLLSGIWRQPVSGAWRDNLSAGPKTPRTSTATNPVDPLGFWEAQLAWSLAL